MKHQTVLLSNDKVIGILSPGKRVCVCVRKRETRFEIHKSTYMREVIHTRLVITIRTHI